MRFATLITTGAAASTAIALMAAPTLASATELLTNGGFEDIGAGAVPESWGGLTYYTDGTHAAPAGVFLPGWTVEAGSVDLAWTTSMWGPAYGGSTYSLDINGWDAGTISQSFGTVAGRVYTVSYAYSRNPANAPSPAEATLAVGGVNRPVTAINDGSFGSTSNMLWKTDSFTFVGDGNAATIRLSAITQGNAGVFFDAVSVTAVPEPAAWALMIMGFGGAGALLRRRRSLATA